MPTSTPLVVRTGLAVCWAGVSCVSLSAQTLRTERVAQVPTPVYLTHAPGDASRVFIVSQQGTARVLRIPQNTLLPTPFLTITNVGYGGERGFLGMAFHPRYAENGYVFVAFNENGTGMEAIGRFAVSASDPDVVDPASYQVVLRFPHAASNHNAGWIAFGPDGYLYMSSGDGAGSAQSLTGLGGKILRLDVDGDDFPADPDQNYRIPPDNPLVGTANRPELWAWGLRNPWRCCFDSLTGDLYIGDVGSGTWEEVDFQPAGRGGLNYGWTCYEGFQRLSGNCDSLQLWFPFIVYGHSTAVPPANITGCAISGGEVYRGCAIPGLRGTYFFADYCSARIVSLRYDGAVLSDVQERTAELDPPGSLTINSISGFGRDALGEVYICDLGGEVFKILPAETPPDCNVNGQTDSCDIATGISRDVNLNGVPDECEAGRPGDLDGDDDVDLSDLSSFLSAFGTCIHDPGFNPAADIVADMCVNLQDLAALLANFGS
ncbi:MAG: PQQ-dependent sugar dehydrogenase [Planctomycetes bacterium]|nr:PQQ-dependent sugar dehydrogenase [Planctomycetota bacterium]